jgi:hypothetical protein
VCGLDSKIPGYHFRQLEVPAKDEVFAQMETALALAEGEK